MRELAADVGPDAVTTVTALVTACEGEADPEVVQERLESVHTAFHEAMEAGG